MAAGKGKGTAVAGASLPHITVCICTRKRERLLRRLLVELDRQEAGGLFTFSIVVTDNDPHGSAQNVVEQFAAASARKVVYCREPEPNIAVVRNRALGQAEGEYVACIDDDELPACGWLRHLLVTCTSSEADAVLGPVGPYFEHEPPTWVVTGGFFERRRFPTGHLLHWSQTRTGNMLFRRDILDGLEPPFRPEFGTGSEDLDFFKRLSERGRTFVWCDEAPVYELVPPSRCTLRYVLRRALIQAGNFPKVAPTRLRQVAKSALAVPLYALALPFQPLFGTHRFVWYLEKMSYHAAYILASCGYTPKLTRG